MRFDQLILCTSCGAENDEAGELCRTCLEDEKDNDDVNI